jgi:hypothetical protein
MQDESDASLNGLYTETDNIMRNVGLQIRFYLSHQYYRRVKNCTAFLIALGISGGQTSGVVRICSSLLSKRSLVFGFDAQNF